MTRINWAEVSQINRLDELILYSIVTLEEAYSAPENQDRDGKEDFSEWCRWEIAYDEAGRAYFRYGVSLYLRDLNPLESKSFFRLIYAPTRWLVSHANLFIDGDRADTTLTIDTSSVPLGDDVFGPSPTSTIPAEVNTLERLLFWAIVVAEWWGKYLIWLADQEFPVAPDTTPLDLSAWGGNYPVLPEIVGEENGQTSIDRQFDDYNGDSDRPGLPDFLANILDRGGNGTGQVTQDISLPAKDSGVYRENLVTCEEQDPKLINFSKQQLDTLLPKEAKK
jgi:hypothetical protein